MQNNNSMFEIDEMHGSSQVLVTETALTNTASIPASDSRAQWSSAILPRWVKLGPLTIRLDGTLE